MGSQAFWELLFGTGRREHTAHEPLISSVEEVPLAGLSFFDDEADVRRLPGAVLAVARDPAAARRTAAAARAEVERRVGEAMRVVAGALEQPA